jgi:hypothetical protein
METSGDGKSGGKLWRLASALNASKPVLPHTSASAAEARRMTTDGPPECTACDGLAMVVLSLPNPGGKPRRQYLRLTGELSRFLMIAIQITAPF